MSYVTLYVTRWVLSRGVLIMKGALHRRMGDKGALKDWYRLEKPYRDVFRHSQVCLGNEAFLTLQEAEENARVRFKEAKALYQARTNDLVRASRKVAEGKLKVHDLTHFAKNFSINELKAFE